MKGYVVTQFFFRVTPNQIRTIQEDPYPHSDYLVYTRMEMIKPQFPQAMKLDVEFKEDKINSLTREVADLENRGADQEEVRRICLEELIFANN